MVKPNDFIYRESVDVSTTTMAASSLLYIYNIFIAPFCLKGTQGGWGIEEVGYVIAHQPLLAWLRGQRVALSMVQEGF